MTPKRKFETSGVAHYSGGQIHQVLNDRFEAAAASRFPQREEVTLIG
jgi:hypothetical protein